MVELIDLYYYETIQMIIRLRVIFMKKQGVEEIKTLLKEYEYLYYFGNRNFICGLVIPDLYSEYFLRVVTIFDAYEHNNITTDSLKDFFFPFFVEERFTAFRERIHDFFFDMRNYYEQQ